MNNIECIKILEEYFNAVISGNEDVVINLDKYVNEIFVLNQYMIFGNFEQSDENYRLAFYINIFVSYKRGFIKNKFDLKFAIHSYNQSEFEDKAMYNLYQNLPSNSDFLYQNFDLSDDLKVVYFDQNIISNLWRDDKFIIDNFRHNLLTNKKILCYSPNHLEEVHRLPKDRIENFIDFLSKITNNIIIMPTKEGYALRVEHPKKSFNRVEKSIESSIALQAHYKLQRENGEYLFPQYHQKQHKSDIGSKVFKDNFFDDMDDKIFMELSQVARGVFYNKNPKNPPFKKSDFKDLGLLKDRVEFIHRIKTLMIMMDLYGYKIDRKVKDGALYDPEHICYALNSDFFVSNDKNLISRIEQIIIFINSNTKCFSYQGFVDYLNN